jgi:hypothetical protein
VEVNVKGAHREDAVLRDLLAQRRELRQRSEALRAAGGGSRQEQMAFGEAVAAAVADRQRGDAERVVASLGAYASQLRPGPLVDGCFVNASFLVATGGLADFDAAVSRLRGEMSAHADVSVYGPLPPYSFVNGAGG